jgi:NTP pyrophosphatase (non-canonical NTP hydrolase)
MNELQQQILTWAKKREILDKATPETQLTKVTEEHMELVKAIHTKDEIGIIDGIGDSAVTLIILADLCGYDFEECVEYAYKQIKNRTGKMVDGVYVKDK